MKEFLYYSANRTYILGGGGFQWILHTNNARCSTKRQSEHGENTITKFLDLILLFCLFVCFFFVLFCFVLFWFFVLFSFVLFYVIFTSFSSDTSCEVSLLCQQVKTI